MPARQCPSTNRGAAMKRIVGIGCLLSRIAAFPVVPIAAQTLGMIMDNNTRKAVVFNADTDTVTGSVPLGGAWKQIVESRLQEPVHLFAYPFGEPGVHFQRE